MVTLERAGWGVWSARVRPPELPLLGSPGGHRATRCPSPGTAPFPRARHLGTFSPMRLGRRAQMVDQADVVIDLRERLAPYTGDVAVLDEVRVTPESAPTLAAPLTR